MSLLRKKNYKDRTIEVNIGAHTSISRVDKLKDTYSSELNNENGKNIFPAGKDTLHTFSSMKSKQFSHKLLRLPGCIRYECLGGDVPVGFKTNAF